MPDGRRAFVARAWGEEKAATYDVPPGPLWWLVDLLDDAGTCRREVGGMGETVLLPLGWRDLHAWTEGAGEHDLSPVFRRALLLLSGAHAATAMAATEVGCEAPYDPGAEG